MRIIAFLLLMISSAFAQSSANFITGQVPSAAQWNALFASKQDYNGAGAFTSLTVRPTPSSLMQGINSLQTASGSPGTTTNFNQIVIASDSVDAGTSFVDGLSLVHSMGGSSTKGGRQALQVLGSLDGATNTANGNRFYVGATLGMQAQASDGGGIGTEKGNLFGINPYVLLTAAAAHMAEASIGEFNTRLLAGSSTLNKYGLKIVQVADDAVAGSVQDAAVVFANQVGAVGWGTLIQIGDGVFQTPLKTTGSILAIKGSPTFAHGIDLSGGTCSTDCFKSTNFNIAGGGFGTFGAGLSSTFVTTPNVYGGGAAGSVLTLQSTANGSPSGDILALTGSRIFFQNFAGARPLYDFFNNFDGSSMDIRAVVKRSNGSQVVAAIINPGFSTNTVGAEVGDIDFLVCGTVGIANADCNGLGGGMALQAGLAITGAVAGLGDGGFIPFTDNNYILGWPSQRFKDLQVVTGNFGSYVSIGTKIRAAGAAPALTSCGTSPAISGSDLAGEVIMGTGTPAGCVITFNVTYSSTPYCTVSWQATPLASQSYVVSTAAITLTQTATSSNKVNYTCVARSAG